MSAAMELIETLSEKVSENPKKLLEENEEKTEELKKVIRQIQKKNSKTKRRVPSRKCSCKACKSGDVCEINKTSKRCIVYCIAENEPEELPSETVALRATEAIVAASVTATVVTTTTTAAAAATASATAASAAASSSAAASATAASSTAATTTTTTASSASASGSAGGGPGMADVAADATACAMMVAVYAPVIVESMATTVSKIRYGLFFVVPGTSVEENIDILKYLNVGAEGENSSHGGDRRLESSLDGLVEPEYKTGMYKYCNTLDIEPVFFMANVFFVFAIAGFAALTLIVLVKMVLRFYETDAMRSKPRCGCLKRILKPRVVSYLKGHAVFTSLGVKLPHMFFYPICIAAFFQFHVYFTMHPAHPQHDTAFIMAFFSAAVVISFCSWVGLTAYCAYHPRPEKSPDAKMIVNVRRRVNKQAESFSEHYRSEARLFWVARDAYLFVNAIILSAVLSPTPIQAILLMLTSFAMLLLTIRYKPYKAHFANLTAYVYCGLNVFNMGLFVVYSLETGILDEDGYATLGTIQVYTNLALVFFLLLSSMAKRNELVKRVYAKTLKTFKTSSLRSFVQRSSSKSSHDKAEASEDRMKCGGDASMADTEVEMEVDDTGLLSRFDDFETGIHGDDDSGKESDVDSYDHILGRDDEMHGPSNSVNVEDEFDDFWGGLGITINASQRIDEEDEILARIGSPPDPTGHDSDTSTDDELPVRPRNQADSPDNSAKKQVLQIQHSGEGGSEATHSHRRKGESVFNTGDDDDDDLLGFAATKIPSGEFTSEADIDVSFAEI